MSSPLTLLASCKTLSVNRPLKRLWDGDEVEDTCDSFSWWCAICGTVGTDVLNHEDCEHDDDDHNCPCTAPSFFVEDKDKKSLFHICQACTMHPSFMRYLCTRESVGKNDSSTFVFTRLEKETLPRCFISTEECFAYLQLHKIQQLEEIHIFKDYHESYNKSLKFKICTYFTTPDTERKLSMLPHNTLEEVEYKNSDFCVLREESRRGSTSNACYDVKIYRTIVAWLNRTVGREAYVEFTAHSQKRISELILQTIVRHGLEKTPMLFYSPRSGDSYPSYDTLKCFSDPLVYLKNTFPAIFVGPEVKRTQRDEEEDDVDPDSCEEEDGDDNFNALDERVKGSEKKQDVVDKNKIKINYMVHREIHVAAFIEQYKKGAFIEQYKKGAFITRDRVMKGHLDVTPSTYLYEKAQTQALQWAAKFTEVAKQIKTQSELVARVPTKKSKQQI